MPSIGKDLLKIRKYLGLTLQDIQFATKLPQHTLEKIENDSIFVDAEEGPIYTRNFVRSYGRVLKIDDDVLIEALDQREAGNYNHLLLKQYPALKEELPEDEKTSSEIDKTASGSAAQAEQRVAPEKSPENKDEEQTPEESGLRGEKQKDTNRSMKTSESEAAREKNGASSTHDKSKEDKSKEDAGITPPSKKKTLSSASGAKGTSSSKKRSPKVKSTKEVDWADVGQKIKKDDKQAPVWLIGLIILLIILGAAGYFIVQSGLLSSNVSSQEEITTPPEESGTSSLSLELDEPDTQPEPQAEISEESPDNSPAVSLDDTLNIVVYAAFENIDPVRVWSDTKPRFDPYWIEEGNAMIFDFEDTIQIRGPYESMLLFFNGHLIENAVQNFFNDEESYLELSRSDFTSDSKWSESTALQVPEGVDPPEETRSRPTF